MRISVAALLYLALCACASQPPVGCTPEAARGVATSFLAAMRSDDCESILRKIAVDEFWVKECRRLRDPDRPVHSEFDRRTTAAVDEIRSKDGRTYAVLRFNGPDLVAFQLALVREGGCLDPQRSAAPWAGIKLPGQTGCGEAFWAGIPVKDYQGAIALECRDGRWMVGGDR